MYAVHPGGQPRERGNRILGPFIPIPLTMIDDLKVTPTYKYVSRARMVFTCAMYQYVIRVVPT